MQYWNMRSCSMGVWNHAVWEYGIMHYGGMRSCSMGVWNHVVWVWEYEIMGVWSHAFTDM